ncbi:hypothetical protein FGO68_gene16844 [Halteria grandinella]|uniref:Uncharacterized protein n=1 Tax=Halteria grandinella TaxID=5974 RepID=A0A8J8NY56_HALGN|nr:hypothetical protein FGO68_gene16844 [Halteria grandinella]
MAKSTHQLYLICEERAQVNCLYLHCHITLTYQAITGPGGALLSILCDSRVSQSQGFLVLIEPNVLVSLVLAF